MTKSLSLLSWRRRVADLYAEIRAIEDAAGAHQVWREGRDDLFRDHPDSPLTPAARERFTELPVAPYDPALRFDVEVNTDVASARIEAPTGTDGVVPFDRIGVVRLDGLGTLDVWWLASYGGGVFIPVKDALAGDKTYGGGRYLIDTVKGADLGGDTGRLIIDLNFAYNPSCAYDPAWACPLAPRGNVLAAPIHAGEMAPPPD